MRRGRPAVAGLWIAAVVIATACGREQPPAAAAAPTPAPAKAEAPSKAGVHGEAIMPKHDPSAMAEGDAEAAVVETQGSMQATMGGVGTHFEFLPTGSNVALVDEAKGVARLSIGGAPTDKGMPLLRVSIDGMRIDRVALPATFTAVAPDAADDPKAPRVRIEYRITDDKIWRAVAGATVTIESYSGKRVRGTFAGKLEPKSAAFGPPIEITDGKFDVELRLKGAAPGPA